MIVYSLVNKEFGEVEYVSIDREVIEEIMMDNFMLNFQGQCQASEDEDYINVETPNEDTYTIIKDNWDILMRWYKEYYDISENRLI